MCPLDVEVGLWHQVAMTHLRLTSFAYYYLTT